MKRHITLLVTFIVLMAGAVPEIYAADLSAVKARMSQRLGKVVSLKQSGAFGENNLGYLSARKSLSAADAKLLAAENADRKAVYIAIAAKAKSSASTVGKTRAASIRKTAPAGTWVQLASGKWKRM